MVEVTWVGPDYKNDFISITRPDEEDGTWINYTYTKQGSPLRIQVPLDPGDYQIRYVLSQDRMVTARANLVATPVTGTVAARQAGPVVHPRLSVPGAAPDGASSPA